MASRQAALLNCVRRGQHHAVTRRTLNTDSTAPGKSQQQQLYHPVTSSLALRAVAFDFLGTIGRFRRSRDPPTLYAAALCPNLLGTTPVAETNIPNAPQTMAEAQERIRKALPVALNRQRAVNRCYGGPVTSKSKAAPAADVPSGPESVEQLTDPNAALTSPESTEWWRAVIHDVAEQIGAAPPTDNTVTALVRMFASNIAYEAYPEASFVLNDMRRRALPDGSRLRIGCLSDTDDRLEPVLKSLDMRRFLDVVVTSFSCGYAKPDKRAFEALVHEINVDARNNHFGNYTFQEIRPNQVMYIGDSPKKDYQAASDAGLHAMLLLRDPETDLRPVFTGTEEDERNRVLLAEIFAEKGMANARPDMVDGVPIADILPDLMPLHSGFTTGDSL